MTSTTGVGEVGIRREIDEVNDTIVPTVVVKLALRMIDATVDDVQIDVKSNVIHVKVCIICWALLGCGELV